MAREPYRLLGQAPPAVFETPAADPQPRGRPRCSQRGDIHASALASRIWKNTGPKSAKAETSAPASDETKPRACGRRSSSSSTRRHRRLSATTVVIARDGFGADALLISAMYIGCANCVSVCCDHRVPPTALPYRIAAYTPRPPPHGLAMSL